MARDQLIRMAIRIQRQLARPVHSSSCEWEKAVTEMLQRAGVAQHQFELVQTATHRGWHAAAMEKQRHALSDLGLLENAIQHLRSQHPPATVSSNGPPLRTIIEELQQLKGEFEAFEIDLKQGLIGATTEPIELEGTYLGPFTIELHVSRLADRLDSDCFRLIALEPNPASSNSGTVHPHVQDNHLCAGDATVPISIALKEGRIADAFILIRSVLMSYNEDSPYVSLQNWKGRNCAECGDSTDSDSLYYCEDCEHDVCEDCYSSCDICNEGCCRNCLEKDPVTENRCCPACRGCCSACNRTVEKDDFDNDTELCPECLEKQKQQQENKDETVQSSAPDNATDTTANPVPPTPVSTAA